MKAYLLIYILFLVFAGTACHDNHNLSYTLDEAEDIMELYPDSAYMLLQSVDRKEIKGRGACARYALLYTQAQDKNYIDETNDSLISIATDYYRNHGDVRQRFLSLYYKGRVLYNAGDYLHAMLYYSEAEGLINDLQDGYYVGLLYSQLGDIYRKYYDFSKSLASYQQAENCYKQVNKDIHKLYASYDQSIVYLNMGKYHQCDSVLQCLLQKTENQDLMELALKNKLLLCVRQKLMEEAEAVYNKLLSDYDVRHYGTHFMSCIVELYLSKGDLEQAKQVMTDIWKNAKTAKDSIDCYITSSLISESENNHAIAFKEYEMGIAKQNQLVRETLQQPVHTMQSDYLAQELELRKYQLREEMMFQRIYTVVTVVILGGIVAFFYFILKKKKREYTHKILAYDELRNSLLHNNSEMSGLVHELFNRHFKIIDRLGIPYYDSSDDKQLNKRICIEVNRLINEYVNGDTYQEVERIVNTCNENVMSLLREEIKLKDERDYRLICYNLIGFSANTISVFIQGISPNNVYQKRSRLKKYIKESDALHRDLFLRILFKLD